MNKKNILLLFVQLFLGTILTSCDPAIAVVLENKTESDKHIKVFYPKEFKFPGDIEYSFGIRDSIQTYNLNDANSYLNPTVMPKVDWDTIAKTYSFVLKSNYKAKIESRFLAVNPTWGQTFVIEKTDTIKLEPKSKDFKRRPKITFGGTWTHTIVDSKDAK
jgi:hypothetical protein